MLSERSVVIALVYAQAGAQSAPVVVTPRIGRAVGNALGSASFDPVQSVSRAAKFATLETRRGLEPKFVPQFTLGWLLGTARASYWPIFPMSLITVPEVFTKVDSA